MKKKFRFVALLFAAFLMAGTIASCSDDDDKNIETVIPADNLPQSAKDFLSKYYPSVKIAKVEKDTDNGVMVYEAYLANGHEVTFNSNGEWVEVDAPYGQTIPAGIVPSAIETYLNANYQDYGVNDITKNAKGYEVDLVTGVDLLFDSEGNFIRVEP